MILTGMPQLTAWRTVQSAEAGSVAEPLYAACSLSTIRCGRELLRLPDRRVNRTQIPPALGLSAIMAAVNKSTIRLVFLLAFYVFFLIVGAAIFSAIEGPVENERLRKLRADRNQFLFDRRTCLTGG
jgi:hypothetical protein